jgi:predicted RNA binding protein YcfA (HicA-like mRNA interferase family)
MNDTVTFALFDALLRPLGFHQGSVPGSHVYYEHPESGTVVMARLHKPTDWVPWHTFASTRKILLERGVLTAEEFEKLTGVVAV